MSPEDYQQYGFYLRKFIHVMCYQKVVTFRSSYTQMLSCLPGCKGTKEDFFLSRCRALSQFITFARLGHDNRHTTAQYKEFWDCAIERASCSDS